MSFKHIWVSYTALIVLTMMLSINFISASFEVGNISHSIETHYAKGDVIKGWINISLENEQANSVFKTSLDDTISLIELMKKSNAEYTCSPINCEIDYSAKNGAEEKIFDLNRGKNKIYGLRITGNIETIESVDFNVQSDSLPSCVNQLKIDILNDGVIDAGNNKVSNEYCYSLQKYGCFDDTESSDDFSIRATPYCQKIKLSESPGFKLGAWIKEKTNGAKKLTIGLYDTDSEEIENAKCELAKSGISSSGGEVSCDVGYLVTKSEEYYICIYSDTGSGEYQIRGYSATGSEACGFYGYPVKDEVAAYQIFATGKKFGSFGTVEIKNSLPNGESFAGLAENYIQEKYDLDCSNECIIPIKFISEANQQIIIDNLELKFETSAGATESKKFYELGEYPAKIDADFQKVYLDEAEFSVPDDFGEKNFKLELGGSEIFSEKIFIERVSTIESLTPGVTIAAIPTEFTANISSPSGMNVTKYEWAFGDGHNSTTSKNKVTHAYNSVGLYKLKLSITDSNLFNSSKIFNVVVGSPKDAVNVTLKKKLEYLTKVKAQISNFSQFYQNTLNLKLNISDYEDKIKIIQRDYAGATSDDDYTKVMGDLIALNIPKSISITKSADSLSFYPKKNIIDLDVLKEVGEGDYAPADKDEYIDAVYAWNHENLEAKITYKEFSATYEHSIEPVMRSFELSVKEKQSLVYDSYIILRKLDDLKFKESYSEREQDGYVYITLTEPEKTIIFLTTEDVDFVDLPLFISPGLNRLTIAGGGGGEEPEFPWALLILVVFLFILFAIAAYVGLQVWYKKKYEDYLFKNRNDLYNIITYINNAKRQGLDDKKIIAGLKKAGWKSEQINYAIKKYGGKHTGMWELPIKKVISSFPKVGKKPEMGGVGVGGSSKREF